MPRDDADRPCGGFPQSVIAHAGTKLNLPDGNDLVCPDCGSAVKWAHPLFSIIWERCSEDTICKVCGCRSAPVLRTAKTNLDNLEANR